MNSGFATEYFSLNQASGDLNDTWLKKAHLSVHLLFINTAAFKLLAHYASFYQRYLEGKLRLKMICDKISIATS